MEDPVGGLLSRGILNAQNWPFVIKILKCLIKGEEGRDFPLITVMFIVVASRHWAKRFAGISPLDLHSPSL